MQAHVTGILENLTLAREELHNPRNWGFGWGIPARCHRRDTAPWRLSGGRDEKPSRGSVRNMNHETGRGADVSGLYRKKYKNKK